MRFSHVAGDPVLDLLNTVDWRLSPEQRHERLASMEDVLAWCAEAGLVGVTELPALQTVARADPAAGERVRESVIEARELAYRALYERDAAAAAALGERVRDALTRSELSPAESGLAWRDRDPSSLRSVADRVVRGLARLSARDDLDRLHQCEDAKCGWVYLDTSPRRNRRWCATSDCGDRNRSRAYYARKKASAPSA